MWKIEPLTDKIPKLKNPVLIEGLPGIGNVGKVAVDFLIEELNAKPLYNFYSHYLPHTVFVKEDNLAELPKIQLYYARLKGIDLLLLMGDVQPTEESACYSFSEALLDTFEKFNGKEIVTIGGIGLPSMPEKGRVFCTGNSKGMIARYKKGTKLEDKIYGVVGPIIGVTGLLIGLANKRNIEAIALLCETYGHPMHIDIKGAKEVLKVLKKTLKIEMSLSDLDKEIKGMEEEIVKRVSEISGIQNIKKDVNYIG